VGRRPLTGRDVDNQPGPGHHGFKAAATCLERLRLQSRNLFPKSQYIGKLRYYAFKLSMVVPIFAIVFIHTQGKDAVIRCVIHKLGRMCKIARQQIQHSIESLYWT
jgi:hypothetical protein